MNREEFKKWLLALSVNRKVGMIQNHHTYLPDYTNFDGNNHFSKVVGMRNHHVFVNGWSTIGQHITTFNDGTIMVGGGRHFDRDPAGIKGQNQGAICIEHLGNFDKGRDEMTAEHKKTVIFVNAALNLKFSLDPNADNNVYHHWYDLSSTARTGGTGNTKSCPGTNFFGGNKIPDFERNLLPKIKKELKAFPEYKTLFKPAGLEEPFIGFAMVVRCNALNVRKGPSALKKRVGRLGRGSIVKVFEKKGRWTRINPVGHWVSSYYIKSIQRAKIIDTDPKGLNVRTGPGGRYRKLMALQYGTEVTIHETSDNGWVRIDYLDKWVSGKYVEIIA